MTWARDETPRTPYTMLLGENFPRYVVVLVDEAGEAKYRGESGWVQFDAAHVFTPEDRKRLGEPPDGAEWVGILKF